MSAYKINDKLYWVGAIDYDLREFHGYKVPYGTTYNAYLIIDEKIVLIDTVKKEFSADLIKNIEEIVPLDKIDIVISNHVEPDHSGSLPEVMKRATNATIVTCKSGQMGLEKYYKGNWNYEIVKTGDSINTGTLDFSFVLTPMLHWPDNMVTYCKELKTLFSNDAFGQHYASNTRYDFEIENELFFERLKDYYANIVLPFGMQVNKALAEAAKFDIELICPSHGLMIKDKIGGVLSKYSDWAVNKADENLVVIAYDTMWGTTEKIADKLSKEYTDKGFKVIKFSLKDTHVSTVMTEIIEAKYVFIGSPTLNRGVMPTVAAMLSYLKGLAPKGRIGLAFGAYGWSGESVPIIDKELKDAGFEMLDPIKVQYVLD